jgi:glycosyltransferase involved in cell wall biosynthesis
VSAARPHVVRIITRLNIGGPARQELAVARELGRWYRSTVLAGRPPEHEGELRDERVPVHHVPLVRPVSPATDARALMTLRAELGHLAPDIVHTHMAKAGALGRAAALTCRPRPKLVHTFHGHVLEGYFSPRAQRAFVAAERFLARRTDAIVAVSPEIRDELLELRIGAPSQYHVIPLGLDLEPFAAVTGLSGALRARLGLDGDVPLAGMVGRLVPIKAVDVALRALVEVPGAHLALVGDGELRGELEGVARTLGVADRAHFVGWWDDVPGAMADLDVVVLSSRNEGTPVALIEAGAAGRAVVATDVGGVRSVVEHDRTGLLVPADDPTALAAAMQSLLDDPARRAAMGAHGRVTAAGFGIGRAVDDHRALYEDLLR